MNRTGIYGVLLMCAAALMILPGCSRKEAALGQRKSVKVENYQRNDWQTTVVHRGDITPTIRLSLEQKDYDSQSYQLDLEQQGSLTVKKLYVRQGDRVAKDQLMVSFVNKELDQQIKEQKKQVRSIQRQIDRLQMLQRMQRTKERAGEIVDLIQDRQVAELYLKEIRGKHRKYEIRSKQDGRVTYVEENLRQGTANARTGLITVVSGSKYYEASTRQKYAFRTGQTFRASLEHGKCTMTVVEVHKKKGQKTILFEPEIALDGSGEDLRPEIVIRQKKITDVLYVSSDAVRTWNDKSYLLVEDEKGYPVETPVEVVTTVGKKTVITGSVKEGAVCRE